MNKPKAKATLLRTLGHTAVQPPSTQTAQSPEQTQSQPPQTPGQPPQTPSSRRPRPGSNLRINTQVGSSQTPGPQQSLTRSPTAGRKASTPVSTNPSLQRSSTPSAKALAQGQVAAQSPDRRSQRSFSVSHRRMSQPRPRFRSDADVSAHLDFFTANPSLLGFARRGSAVVAGSAEDESQRKSKMRSKSKAISKLVSPSTPTRDGQDGFLSNSPTKDMSSGRKKSTRILYSLDEYSDSNSSSSTIDVDLPDMEWDGDSDSAEDRKKRLNRVIIAIPQRRHVPDAVQEDGAVLQRFCSNLIGIANRTGVLLKSIDESLDLCEMRLWVNQVLLDCPDPNEVSEQITTPEALDTHLSNKNIESNDHIVPKPESHKDLLEVGLQLSDITKDSPMFSVMDLPASPLLQNPLTLEPSVKTNPMFLNQALRNALISSSLQKLILSPTLSAASSSSTQKPEFFITEQPLPPAATTVVDPEGSKGLSPGMPSVILSRRNSFRSVNLSQPVGIGPPGSAKLARTGSMKNTDFDQSIAGVPTDHTQSPSSTPNLSTKNMNLLSNVPYPIPQLMVKLTSSHSKLGEQENKAEIESASVQSSSKGESESCEMHSSSKAESEAVSISSSASIPMDMSSNNRNSRPQSPESASAHTNGTTGTFSSPTQVSRPFTQPEAQIAHSDLGIDIPSLRRNDLKTMSRSLSYNKARRQLEITENLLDFVPSKGNEEETESCDEGQSQGKKKSKKPTHRSPSTDPVLQRIHDNARSRAYLKSPLQNTKSDEPPKEKLPEEKIMNLLRGRQIYRWLQQRRKGAVKLRPSDEVVKNFRNLFDQLDEAKKGLIPVENLQKLLQGSGMPVSAVAKVIEEVDQDGSGAVDFNEFLAAMVRVNEDDSSDSYQSALLFPILVTTFTRRRHMETVMSRGTRQNVDGIWESPAPALSSMTTPSKDRLSRNVSFGIGSKAPSSPAYRPTTPSSLMTSSPADDF